ncbi:centromere protein T-like [Lampris incognitus]|uniref:centromere protein T-like n=1 Tax=Lampris incognitus TaxID=2546036 RepID=UPI0024B5A608|nr:centromere protein T-like [Lampris incognitus]
MDSSEGAAARVLPVASSASAPKALAQVPAGESRCSARLRRSDSVSLSKTIMKRSLRQSIKTRLSRVSLLSSERSGFSSVVLTTNTPAPTVSILHNDLITPRYLLRNILETGPEVPLLAQEGAEKKKTQLPSVEPTVVHRPSTELSELDLPEMTATTTVSTRKGLGRGRPRRSLNVSTFERNLGENDEPEGPLLAQEGAKKKKTQLPSVEPTVAHRPSTELSELDLPEMTMMTRASTRKGLERGRPRRSLNVTTFERNLGENDDVEEKGEEIAGELSSLSLGSATRRFKMSYAEVLTERTGLRRQITNRCRISVEEFGAALQKRETAGQNSQEVMLSINEMAHSEDFTLGLSNFSQPGFTTDIANQDTSIYAPLSSILEEDMVSNNLAVEDGTDNGRKDQAVEEVKPVNEIEEEEFGADSQTEEEVIVGDDQAVEVKAVNEAEEEEFRGDSQTDEEDMVADDQAVEVKAVNEIEEEELGADSQAEEAFETRTSGGDDAEVTSQPSDVEHIVRRAHRLISPIMPAAVGDGRGYYNMGVVPRTFEAGESSAPAQPRKAQRKKKTLAKSKPSLPKSYLMGVFKYFAKTKVSADVYPVLQTILDRFFDRMAEDLETYCLHAKRKTIEVEDVVLLLKRQGHVTDQVPVEVLIEKYLPMEYRRLLIPVATSGNVVVPKLKR